MRQPGSNDDIVLEFADLSGETYEHAFATRLASAGFLKLVQQMDGLLLFISAARTIDGVTIADVAAEMPEFAAPEATASVRLIVKRSIRPQGHQ